MLIISEDFKKAYPYAKLGILVMKDVTNLLEDSDFIKTKMSVTEHLLKNMNIIIEKILLNLNLFAIT